MEVVSSDKPVAARRGDEDARQLTRQIKQCDSVSDLVYLVDQHAASFNHIHVTAALTKAAKLMRPPLMSYGLACVRQLVKEAGSRLPDCGSEALVTMAWALAKLGFEDPAFMQQLFTHARSKPLQLPPRSIFSMLWAMAKLQHVAEDRQLVQQLLTEAQPYMPASSRGLDSTAWALRTLGLSDSEYMEQLQGHISFMNTPTGPLQHPESQETPEEPGSISHAAAAAAEGEFSARTLTSYIMQCSSARSLVQLVGQHVADFDFIHLSAALSKAAKLMQPPLTAEEAACIKDLLTAVSRCGQLHESNDRGLSSMVCALAKLKYRSPTFMQQLAPHVSRELPNFSARNTASMLWAMAKLGYEDKALTQQLMAHARQLQSFSAQDIASLLWAAAKLQHVAEDRQLVGQLLESAQPWLSTFNEQDLANTAWALAALRHHDDAFMQQLLQRAQGTLPKFLVQGVANILWAMARLNHNDPAFVDGAVRRLLQQPRAVNSQDLCNTLWALSMLQHNTAPVTESLVAAAISVAAAANAGGLSDVERSEGDQSNDGRLNEDLCQIHPYLVTMEGAGHVGKKLQESPQYQQLRGRCRDALHRRFAENCANPPPFLGVVMEAVRQLPGCEGAQAGQLTEDQDLGVDIGLTLPCGTKMAIELESQASTMANAPALPLGPVLWRRQQLAARGYEIVVVVEADWRTADPLTQRVHVEQRSSLGGHMYTVVTLADVAAVAA